LVERKEIEKLRGKRRGEEEDEEDEERWRRQGCTEYSAQYVHCSTVYKSAVLLLFITYIYAYFTLYTAQYAVK
jgi:hypothetical protein